MANVDIADEEAGAPDGAPAERPRPVPERAGPPRSGTLFVITACFITVILTPLITFFVFKATQSPAMKKQGEAGLPPKRIIYTIDPITVNIMGTADTRYLKVVVHLVLSEKRLEEDLKDYKTMIKDRIIRVCKAKRISELGGRRGPEELKREIMAEVNSAIQDKMKGAIIDVEFSEYLIQ
ncbi:MAG: flagellar basal body-associated FliL family protein [Kiritimatiellae bacterium]|nr:flagellar basal body-associated FliL family protein [Kiritimatiellia bacterium]